MKNHKSFSRLPFKRLESADSLVVEQLFGVSAGILSHSELVKHNLPVPFLLMTMIAHSLYHFLSQKLRGFEECRASTIFRKFINMKADVAIRDGDIIVKFPRRAHNPIIKSAQLDKAPSTISWLGNRKIIFEFK